MNELPRDDKNTQDSDPVLSEAADIIDGAWCDIAESDEKALRRQHFDIARHELYSLVAAAMHGEGGESIEHTVENINGLLTQSANSFWTAAAAICNESNDDDLAIQEVAQLYLDDEAERLALLEQLPHNKDFIAYTKDQMLGSLAHEIAEHPESADKTTRELLPDAAKSAYIKLISHDLGQCLEVIPPNRRDLQLQRRTQHIETAKSALIDVTKIASATFAALYLNDKLRRH